ncbi:MULTISPECIES: hypothetical protein [unclassified Pseudomonas]|uniref:hypothetical protein n=1 Tax=unclassified Pseudomonas TaxID=196821 RepID=UPI0021BAF82D|nr:MULTISPECIES: hypothetical protein [unclassified Pseudomonas]MCT8165480.1 hypothetical protein [Pseudomonas sp. HD6422]MCT8184566.1 hypothetical protein [Pseudomonas sp. HD6421]
MSTTELFSGPFYEWLRRQEPLCAAEFFTKGSSAMLFQRDGRLYRLTRDGCGHNFLAWESMHGNQQVMRFLQDFGAVAPSDEGGEEEFYWLAEVEWLDELDRENVTVQRLAALLDELSDGEQLVMEPDLPALIERCQAMAVLYPEFAPLLKTLAKAARSGADADVHISNLMRRSSTGELVWIDPLFGASYLPDEQSLERMMSIRASLGMIQAEH